MNPRLEELSTGICPLYVATRLFDNGGRYFGAQMERACAMGIEKSMRKNGFTPAGKLTYLPFRDSNESVVQKKGESLTRAIFRVDCEMLSNSFALFAPVYDLQQDSGISFEIGFAFAKRVPVILLAGNFFKWSINNLASFSVEPIYSFVSDEIVDVGEFGLVEEDKTRSGYIRKLEDEFDKMSLLVEEALFEFCESAVTPTNTFDLQESKIQRNVHLEFGGGQYDFQRHFAKLVSQRVNDGSFTISSSTRHSNEDYRSGLTADLELICSSEAVIFLGDGSEVDPEIAFMLGFCSGKNKNSILYFSGGKQLSSPPDYLSPRNLMVSESVQGIVGTFDELESAIRKLMTTN